jgi:hypothetical protein
VKFRWPWQKKAVDAVNAPVLNVHRRELIEIGKTVRVENGPARKTAVATAKLLSDAVTAPHYKEGAPDSMGRMIRLGDHMNFLDYYGEWVWYVYKWSEAEKKWIGRGFEGTKEAALALAEAIKED